MSDYHILSADEYGNKFNIIMHVPVPDVDNDVGMSYRIAIVQFQGGAPIASSLPWITGTEQTALDSGEIIESSIQFNSNPTQTLPEKRDALDMIYAQTVTELQSKLSKQLQYWSYDRDVS